MSPAPGPVVYVRTHRYSVCALPEDHPEARHATLFVEYRGQDRWAVTWPGSGQLSRSGNWSYEPLPSERQDLWLEQHRFSCAEALRLAREKAPLLRIGPLTVHDLLHRGAGRPR